MKRNTEEGGRLTDSVSSRAKSNQVGLSPTWAEIAWGALYSQVLRSRGAAEAEENLTESAPSAISSQCQQRGSQVTQGAAEGYLAVSELTLGASRQVDLPHQCFFSLVHQDPAVPQNNFTSTHNLKIQWTLYKLYTSPFWEGPQSLKIL